VVTQDAPSAGPKAKTEKARTDTKLFKKGVIVMARLSLRRRPNILLKGSFTVLLHTALLATAVAVAALSPSIPAHAAASGLPEAPDFSLVELLDGGEIDVFTLSEHTGRPVVLYFWTTYCPYCAVDLPRLLQAFPELGKDPDGPLFLAVDVGEREAVVRAHLEHKGYDMRVLLDREREVAFMYRAIGTPTYVWITADRRIARQHLGPLAPELFAQYLREIVPDEAAPGTASGPPAEPRG